jgi:predicted ABC-type ATPase
VPDLYVIAGPNGAGKSSFSFLMVPHSVNVFDADKLLREREQAFPDVDPWRLMEAIVDHDFEAGKNKAIRGGADFAYETNFSDENPLATAKHFAQAGYRTNLYFIGLDSPDSAINRVARRVEEGGHDVPNEEIAARYHLGLQNLARNIAFFDRAVLFDNQKSIKIAMPRRFLDLEKGVIVTKHFPIPNWAKNFPIKDLSLDKSPDSHRSKGKKR